LRRGVRRTGVIFGRVDRDLVSFVPHQGQK
jgi:hypothetical protein